MNGEMVLGCVVAVANTIVISVALLSAVFLINNGFSWPWPVCCMVFGIMCLMEFRHKKNQ